MIQHLFVDTHTQLSTVLGPFVLDADFLLVADYNQQNIYQITPQSGDARALPMNPCKPVSLVFDPKIKGVYVTCNEQRYFRIHKKTFDGKIDRFIYYSPLSTYYSRERFSVARIYRCLSVLDTGDRHA